MARKKSKSDTAIERMADLILEHAGTLSPSRGKAMLRDILGLSVKSSRSATRGKASRSRKSAGPRPLSRKSAGPA